MANPNDEFRRQILRYFYDRNAHSTSRLGKKGSAVRISDAKRELKESYGLTQQQVMSNLTYLVDQRWVKTFEVSKTVNVRGGTIPSSVVWYEVTAAGIDKIERESEFSPKESFSGINIHASGRNVITLGDGNVIDARFEGVHDDLQELASAFKGSDVLNEEIKLSVVADIESLKDQLAKPEPDRRVIEILWENIDRIAATAGIVDLATKVGSALSGVVG